jgi:LMBR1 domain-containing protein 1
MGVDLFLLAVVIIIAVALLICNVYILVYFQHDDDKNTAYFPKALVVRPYRGVLRRSSALH